MRKALTLTLLFAVFACGGCKQAVKGGSKEFVAAMEKQAAARDAARIAEQMAARAAEAQRAQDLRAAVQHALEADLKAQEAARLSQEARAVERLLADAGERQELRSASEEVGQELKPILDRLRAVREEEARQLARKLERDTVSDAERVAMEEGKPPCRATLSGLSKEAVCVYLKSYIKDPARPVADEVLDKVGESAVKSCLPEVRTSVWFKRGKAFSSLRAEIEKEPNNVKKLELAAVGYGCDLR